MVKDEGSTKGIPGACSFGKIEMNIQSETTDFALVAQPGELDETYASSLIRTDSLHYMKT